MGGPTIYNIQYYWVGPPYIISDITGSAHHHLILYIRYYWVSPAAQYYICDITGSALVPHIIYAKLMGGPTIYKYNITGSA
jgi:hypothetical protein